MNVNTLAPKTGALQLGPKVQIGDVLENGYNDPD
jgi:hypothetical protein